uniref:NADH-ubiquinone oxidoreductase chain 6 n=1 Tax=Haemodracon trachyrhinus TaxID=1216929 RepID=A0A7R7J456_9SAUR|nr:NADH dehydrogenase subunit 6 [Haemodracon trachyrhinus]
MSYIVLLLVFSLLLGVVGVASNPSPFYGVGGLVISALMGCGLLVCLGGSFMGVVLLLIYLGGMLVVFVYSVALAAEPYPMSWGNLSVFFYFVSFVVLLILFGGVLVGWSGLFVGVGGLDGVGFSNFRSDMGGVVLLFSHAGWLLLLAGWGLMLALFVVLELTRGRARGSLRVP